MPTRQDLTEEHEDLEKIIDFSIVYCRRVTFQIYCKASDETIQNCWEEKNKNAAVPRALREATVS